MVRLKRLADFICLACHMDRVSFLLALLLSFRSELTAQVCYPTKLQIQSEARKTDWRRISEVNAICLLIIVAKLFLVSDVRSDFMSIGSVG